MSRARKPKLPPGTKTTNIVYPSGTKATMIEFPNRRSALRHDIASRRYDRQTRKIQQGRKKAVSRQRRDRRGRFA